MKLSKNELARMIDHTLLKPTATRDQILQLCEEGRKFQFASVCVNGCWVKLCAETLKNTEVRVCSVVGFPLGAMETAVKVYEATLAVEDGAAEIDMVMNVGKFLSGDVPYVENDIHEVVKVSRLVKVILETGYLTDEEVVRASELAKRAGAHYVKTSTGFGPPFELRHISLMRKTVGKDMGVKAAGGINSFQKAMEVIEAGADRIGASAGVKIVEGL